MELFGYFFAILVGISLGLFGSGGSILSVPILVYIMKIEPVLATSYSLFIVGNTALIGGLQKAKQQLVDFQKVFLFGIPTLITVFLVRKFVVPNIPDEVFITDNLFIKKSILTMIFFAIVMILAAIKMIKPTNEIAIAYSKINYFSIIITAVLIGIVAGLAGAGGGFLIIPALIFLTKSPMKTAVGTSLFIVTIQSLTGFLGDLSHLKMDWKLLIGFTICSIIGIFIGNVISKKINAEKLKTAFGFFVLLMGILIFLKEIFTTYNL